MTHWKDVGDTVQAFATTGAIIVGGVFTYFKFVKDRVYRPRVNLGIEAEPVDLESGHFMVCRLSLENRGATKLSIQHEGTAVIVRTGSPGDGELDATSWSSVEESGVVDVFAKHAWLESTETVRDDVVVRVSAAPDSVYRVELRLVVVAPHPLNRGNIEISSARVVTPLSAQSVDPQDNQWHAAQPRE